MTSDASIPGLVDKVKAWVAGATDAGPGDGRVVVVVRVTANPGKEDALRELILSSAGRALAAPGNHGFSLLVADDDPAAFTIIEHWESRAHHIAHEHDPAMPKMAAAIAEGDLVRTGPKDTFWTQITSTVSYT